MKKMLFWPVYSLILILFCLALVEVFFQINKKFSFVEAKNFSYHQSNTASSFEANLTPEHIIEEIQTKYENFKPPNFDLIMDLSNSRDSNIRKYDPYLPQKLISMVSKKFEPPFIIKENAFNTKHGVTIFDVRYDFDDHRRRVVKNQKINPNYKNIILVGCSLTFGTGVNQGEDLASHLHKRMPRYNIYNLGIPGAGMNQILYDIENLNRLDDLNNKGGAVVYSMIYQHIERTFCSIGCHTKQQQWMANQNLITYDIDEQGNLLELGSYKQRNKIQFLFRELLAKSATLEYYGYASPPIHDDEEIYKYVQFLKYIKNYYKSKNLEFYIYIPNYGKFLAKNFMQILKNNDISVFSYRHGKDSEPFKGRANIIGDGHWNTMGSDFQSALIADYLKKQGY